jgi:hypothetical protein
MEMQYRSLIAAAAASAVMLNPLVLAAQQSCAVITSQTSSLSREESDSQARGTIADARRFTGDFDKCRTLAVAVQQTRSVTTAKLLFEAAAGLHGDYELAEILVASAERGLLEERTADAYFATARGLASDFQLARVLGAALRARSTNTAIVQGILRSATAVEDDFQLASLLVEVARSATVTGSTRELYGTAARTLQNQWEYRRAMNALTQ